MTVAAVLAKLEALGDEKVRERNVKRGAGAMPQFGVMLGNIRKVAKGVGSNHELAMELWETGNIDARQAAILMLKPKRLTDEDLDRLVRTVGFVQVFDWLDSYVI